jgi:hypothetical protein
MWWQHQFLSGIKVFTLFLYLAKSIFLNINCSLFLNKTGVESVHFLSSNKIINWSLKLYIIYSLLQLYLSRHLVWHSSVPCKRLVCSMLKLNLRNHLMEKAIIIIVMCLFWLLKKKNLMSFSEAVISKVKMEHLRKHF